MAKRKKQTPVSAEETHLREEYVRTEEEIARLRSYLQSEIDRTSGGPDDDAADVASDIYEREKALALIHTLEEKLVSLAHALDKVKAGGYGKCEKCGEPIDPDRLEVVPEAKLCVRCQSESERGTRHRRRAPLVDE
jgi:RNA polymerase-binding transcription factor DksA